MLQAHEQRRITPSSMLFEANENIKIENMNSIPVAFTTNCMECGVQSSARQRTGSNQSYNSDRIRKFGTSRTRNRDYKTKSWTVMLMTLVVMSLASDCVIANSLRFPMDDVAESDTDESRENIHGREIDGFAREDMEFSAKEFLAKFGYVKPAEWNNVSPRSFDEISFNRGLMEGEDYQDRGNLFEGSGTEEGKEIPVRTYSVEGMSEEDFQRALLKYQRINGLNQTGELDNDTTSYMGRPRCGVPDRTAALKANRTAELLRLTMQTASTNAETTSIPATTSENISMNSTTGIWIASNLSYPSNTNQLESVDNSGVTVSAATDSPEYSGDESGEEPDPELVRKKRSDLLELQMEVEFDDEVEFSNESEQIDYDEVRLRQLGFKEHQGGLISEAELSDESRVSDLEEIIQALREEKFSQINGTKRDEIFNDVISSIRPPPAPPVPALIRRMVMETRTNRKKRSSVYLRKSNGWRMASPKPIITWRLVDEWPTQGYLMTSNEIWFTIKLAFRMWSEIIPRSFREDNTSPMTKVDILLGFGRKTHNRCLVPFFDSDLVKEYAHAWPLPQAEIHFNDDQPFVAISWEPPSDVAITKSVSLHQQPISLQKVATHEIGHALGLPHNKARNSVMNPVYTPYQSKRLVELQAIDRQNIQRIYGRCEISFDAVFDWVRQYYAQDGTLKWKYNTYFFRSTWFWLYENRGKRPKYGAPTRTAAFWRGVLSGRSMDPHRKIDGVVHIRDWHIPNGPIYFFTGDTYTEYDSTKDEAKKVDSKGNKYPRKISEGFPGIPSPIDTVFYKMTERRLYFFKDHLVYKYDWRTKTVESIQLISYAFPGWDGASPLPSHIDAAYYSYTDSAYYFFKGIYYWKLADGREKHYNKGTNIPNNAVGPMKRISSKWHYICDVDPTEMRMSLPKKT